MEQQRRKEQQRRAAAQEKRQQQQDAEKVRGHHSMEKMKLYLKLQKYANKTACKQNGSHVSWLQTERRS